MVKIRRWTQKRISWWKVNIKEQVKIKKQRWKEYLQRRTKESYINYKIQRKKVRDMVMNTKKQSWEEFGEKMKKDSKGNQKLFFRGLKSLQREKSEIRSK